MLYSLDTVSSRQFGRQLDSDTLFRRLYRAIQFPSRSWASFGGRQWRTCLINSRDQNEIRYEGSCRNCGSNNWKRWNIVPLLRKFIQSVDIFRRWPQSELKQTKRATAKRFYVEKEDFLNVLQMPLTEGEMRKEWWNYEWWWSMIWPI